VQKAPDGWDTGDGGHGAFHRDGREAGETGVPVTETVSVGWKPGCKCPAHEPVPCIVADIFGGSGTVGFVAQKMGRRAALLDKKPDYIAMQAARIGLFAEVA
jgi:site-specific DNA-methyltransferase (cytosine-N4-specific)